MKFLHFGVRLMYLRQNSWLRTAAPFLKESKIWPKEQKRHACLYA